MMCKTLLMLVLDGPGNAGEVQCRGYTATDVITGVLNYGENVTQVWSFHLKHIGLAKKSILILARKHAIFMKLPTQNKIINVTLLQSVLFWYIIMMKKL